MDNPEASVTSTATRTWHDFLERMRQPSATEFVKQIKNFIVSLSNNTPDSDQDSASIQEFFSNMETNFRVHPLWVGRTEEELDSTGEGLEKYIMTKLFTRVFASHPEDIKIDNELYKKTALIQQFIHPDHLDIKPIYHETSWLQAQNELIKINSYKSPRDKLACILSCCKVISTLMFNASVSGNENENPPGADDFFPVLIYVIIKANPPQFHSNLMYIQRYRNKSRLVGEAAYVFTNMLSAESFILNIDANALSMSETEFVKNMELAQLVVSGLSRDYNSEDIHSQSSLSGQSVSESKLKEVPSVSDLENKGASMVVMEDEASEKFEDFRYLYSKGGDLTIGDVEDLLNGYKKLVFKYVCLAKGMGVPAVPPQASRTQTSDDDGGREGLGVAEPPLETQIGGGTESGLEGEARIGGKMVDAPENDARVEAVRIEGDRNDGVGASTSESLVTSEVGSQIE